MCGTVSNNTIISQEKAKKRKAKVSLRLYPVLKSTLSPSLLNQRNREQKEKYSPQVDVRMLENIGLAAFLMDKINVQKN